MVASSAYMTQALKCWSQVAFCPSPSSLFILTLSLWPHPPQWRGSPSVCKLMALNICCTCSGLLLSRNITTGTLPMYTSHSEPSCHDSEPSPPSHTHHHITLHPKPHLLQEASQKMTHTCCSRPTVRFIFNPSHFQIHPNPIQTGSKFMSFSLMQTAPACDHHLSTALQQSPVITSPCVHSWPFPTHSHTASSEDFIKCTQDYVTWLLKSLRWSPWLG